MPKVVITHAVEDVERWLQGKAERAAAIESGTGSNVTDYVAHDGTNNIAVSADVSDLAALQNVLASPPPEMAAADGSARGRATDQGIRRGVTPAPEPQRRYSRRWGRPGSAQISPCRIALLSPRRDGGLRLGCPNILSARRRMTVLGAVYAAELPAALDGDGERRLGGVGARIARGAVHPGPADWEGASGARGA